MRSPSRWPWLSLTALKWSMSISSSASGSPVTRTSSSAASSSARNAPWLSVPVSASVAASRRRPATWASRRRRSEAIIAATNTAGIAVPMKIATRADGSTQSASTSTKLAANTARSATSRRGLLKYAEAISGSR